MVLVCGGVMTVWGQGNDYDESVTVGFACYFAGTPTSLVESFGRYVRKKQYKTLAEKLTSAVAGERYMAAITLQRLDSLRRYTLHAEQKAVIDTLRQSKVLVPYCQGCVVSAPVEMRMLFEEDRAQFSDRDRWLKMVMGELR